MNNPKFRVWNKKTLSWEHGPGKEPHLFGETILLGGFVANVSIKDLDECIILQFSGLKDKKNVEIYSGDVVKAGAITGIVNFSESAFFIDDTLLFNAFILMAGDIEVIGNIYDNPELASK